MRLLLILLFVSFQSILICKDRPTHLKAFIVYDVSEHSLLRFYHLDSSRMKKNLQGIAAHIKLTADIQVLRSSHVTSQKLYSWIRKLSPKDIAVFYYVGNPMYNPQDANQWPSLDLSHQKMLTLLSQEKITNDIKQQNPHLGLILFDCYRHVVRISKKKYGISPTVPLKKPANGSGLTRLFIESSGIVSACSAHRGETGLAFSQSKPIGGLFTQAFQDYFQLGNDKSSFFWSLVLLSVEEKCSALSSRQQHPLILQEIHNPRITGNHRK